MTKVKSLGYSDNHKLEELVPKFFKELVAQKLLRLLKIDLVYNPSDFGKILLRSNLTIPHYKGFPEKELKLSSLIHLKEYDLIKERDKMLEAILDMSADSLLSEFLNAVSVWIEIAKQRLTLKEILELKNIEQRMDALKIYGVEKLLQDSHAKLINKSERGNELYRIEEVFSQPAYFLKYKDTSTDRVYISGIDPKVFEGKKTEEITADNAMAWKFEWTLQEYSKLKAES